jgi:dephospho-CoA kinase
MPGAGKSIIAKAATDLGLPVYNMGDVIRDETMRLYGEITPEYMRETSRIVRERYGEDYVARKTIERIQERSGVIVIDGVRSLIEVEVFRKFGDTVILAIHASPRTRFERIKRRGRPGDPDKWEDFVKRDMTELSFGLGNVIALADYMIVNEGTVEEAYRGAYSILSKLVEKYGKDQGNDTY